MKKFFLTICFTIIMAASALSRMTQIQDTSAIPQPQLPRNEKPQIRDIPQNALEGFLAERIKDVVIEDKSNVKTESMNTIRSPEALREIAEQNKSEFEKIYNAALNKVTQPRQHLDLVVVSEPTTAGQKKEWGKPRFAVIETVLPDSPEKILIPAQEHIPYLMTKIDVLPDGVVKFEETITVVANGEKLKHGLDRVLPAFIALRDGTKQALSYNVISATVNEQPVGYHLAQDNHRFILTPTNKFELQPGVYTFRFTYLVHHLIGVYADFDELYWNVTGSSWDLVIGKMGATITYPSTLEPLGQVLLVGTPNYLDPYGAEIIKINPTSFGYAGTRPLFIGEGFHIISSLPHGIITPPTLVDRFFIILEKSGAFYISLLTFMVIAGAFMVSRKYIRRNIGQLKISFKKSPQMLRLLYNNRYDFKSFGGFLLELYKKNIIDIQQSDETILLVKRTDHLRTLSKPEQKAVYALFGSNDAVLNVNKNNLIRLKRASKYIEKELKRQLMGFLLKLNSGYIIFSLSMLLAGEFFIALFYHNLPNFYLMATGSLLFIIAYASFYLQSIRNSLNILARAVGTALILLTMMAMTAIIPLVSIIFIFLSIASIFYFTTTYSKRNGLLRPYIEEAGSFKESLLRRRENILLGKEIINQQGNILALDLENNFKPDTFNEYNKLSTMIDMMKKLG